MPISVSWRVYTNTIGIGSCVYRYFCVSVYTYTYMYIYIYIHVHMLDM